MNAYRDVILHNAQPRKMAGYTSAKPRAAVLMQTAMLSFVTGVDLYSKYLIKGKALSHTHTHHVQSHL